MKPRPTHTLRQKTLALGLLGLLVSALLLTALPLAAAPARQDDAANPVTIYFFWGDGCPHCAEAKPFLEELTQRYPTAEVVSFEVWYDEAGQEMFQQMTAAHGFEARYVPTLFVGTQHWVGFADPMRGEIEAAVATCVAEGCPDAGAGIVPGRDPAPAPVATATPVPETVETTIPIYLFWGDAGCEECDASRSHHETQSGFIQLGANGGSEALAFLEALAAEHPNVEVHDFEVWVASRNAARFHRVAEAFGVEASGVPTIFLGERAWRGFSDQEAAEIEAALEACLETGCPGPLDSEATAESSMQPDAPAPAGSPTDDQGPTPAPSSTSLILPIVGTIDLGRQSLWASTALISFADGFNPCSLWVLSILIALTLRTGSRKRIFTIGLIYITVTAGIYVLFIAGLFTFLTVVSFMSWIQTAVSILALFFAAVNIKDYFWYKEGVSFTISDEKKPGIYKRIRKVMNAGNSFWALAGATVALGAGVSFVEFSCTAGFPVIWTNLVAAQDVTPVTFGLLLLLYMVIYQIDELAIFSVAVITLKANRLEEKHGRILKLVGGTLMLTLAAVMLIQPALMNNLTSSLLIFGTAVVVAGIVLLVHRRLLPRFGIRIGTEFSQ